MQVRRLRIGEDFFSTFAIPLLRGRGPRATDSEAAAKVVVVNESFVQAYLPEHDPIGLAFRMWDADWTIIGVCRDAKYDSIKAPPSPTAYFPYGQMFYSRFRNTHLRSGVLAARTTVPPMTLATDVRRAVARVDPGVGVTMITTQEDVRDRMLGRERLLAILCSGLGAVALLLSAIGLYGLMAYNVARRTGEIGVRMALGATRADVAGPILGQALLLAGAGVAVGLPLALAATRLLRSQLFGVQPGDPLSLTLAAAGLVVTAAAAAWIPARRAQRVEPIQALRCDG
jgi:predicted permease